MSLFNFVFQNVFFKSSSISIKDSYQLNYEFVFDTAGYKMSSVSNNFKWHSFTPNVPRAVAKDQRGAFLSQKPAQNELNLLTEIQAIKIQQWLSLAPKPCTEMVTTQASRLKESPTQRLQTAFGVPDRRSRILWYVFCAFQHVTMGN